MLSSSVRLPQRSSVLSLVISCAVMGLVLVPTALVVSAIACGGVTPAALAAAALAFGLCWPAMSLALAATYIGNVLHAPVQGMLGGMLLRMGLPLVGILVLTQSGEAIAQAGQTTTILGVYLVALLVETPLAVRMVPKRVSLNQGPVAPAT